MTYDASTVYTLGALVTRLGPANFLWGAALAGHQVEGGNTNADIWHEEWAEGSTYADPSGDAVDHYHRFAEDIDLLADAGLGALRFSVEWSRVEPEPGFFSTAALEHYRRVLEHCHLRGVVPVVSYNHFTTPAWFAARGGWAHAEAPTVFARYCAKVTQHLGELFDWGFTLNEPNVFSIMSATGLLPFGTGAAAAQESASFAQQVGSKAGARVGVSADVWLPGQMIPSFAQENALAAHRAARAAIHAVRPDMQVGWTLALIDLHAGEGGEEARDAARQASEIWWLEGSRDDAVVGVQTYARETIGPNGRLAPASDIPVNQLGWELYPPALANTCRLAAEVAGVPVMVTEHGVATPDDALRIEQTGLALARLMDEVALGLDVVGYLHWTLLDNFEWGAGFGPSFGLIEVDRATFRRTPKPSLAWLGAFSESGS